MAIWYAGYVGNVRLLRSLLARGVPVDAADYDERTALMLAACEGRADAVRYLLSHGANVALKDRFGNTALDDAKRHGHADIVALLESPPPVVVEKKPQHGVAPKILQAYLDDESYV